MPVLLNYFEGKRTEMKKKLIAVTVAISLGLLIGVPNATAAKDKPVTVQGPPTCCFM